MGKSVNDCFVQFGFIDQEYKEVDKIYSILQDSDGGDMWVELDEALKTGNINTADALQEWFYDYAYRLTVKAEDCYKQMKARIQTENMQKRKPLPKGDQVSLFTLTDRKLDY